MTLPGAFAICISALLIALPARAAQIHSAGRIENAEGGTCSAALVRPDLVLTAAHCVKPGQTLEFRAGDGPNGETFPVERVVLHPLYLIAHWRTDWRLRFDLAVAKLRVPVPGTRARPLPAGPEARAGETLFIVSWRGNEGARPRQRPCPVIPTAITGLITLGCPVIGGESGAPVLRRTEEGLELVAVVSSRNRVLDQPVAHATNVSGRLQPLFDAIDKNP